MESLRGVAINHSGQGVGKYIPNFNALAAASRAAIHEAGISPEVIDYIETHGTGTKLGDPIEIQALAKAFETNSFSKGCALGSKSTIGHLESASGICSLSKVLLAIKHHEIPSCGNLENCNHGLRLEQTPFYIPKETKKWDRPIGERVVGIHSFGVGGSNGFMVIQGVNNAQRASILIASVVVPLSAKTKEQLKVMANNLLRFIEEGKNISLEGLAYTLQVGRENMEERLGIITHSTEDLIKKLTKYLDDEESVDDLYTGQVKKNKEVVSDFATDDALNEAVDKWMSHKKYDKLLKFWTKGLNVDWSKLYSEHKPRRISLPTYPFAKERYWIEKTSLFNSNNEVKGTQNNLHPLVQKNTSTLSEQRFSSTFTGEEFFLRDHIVNSQKILPSEAQLEMAREAVKLALEDRSATIDLKNIVWISPIIIEKEPRNIHIGLFPEENESISYEIYSEISDDEIMVYSSGIAIIGARSDGVSISEEKNQNEQNILILLKQKFSLTLTGEEAFVRDHIIKGKMILPGVAHLELAREAIKQALGDLKGSIQLKNIVWSRPIIIENEPTTVHIELLGVKNGNVSYKIYTEDRSSGVIVHSQGVAVIGKTGDGVSVPDLDIEELKSSHQELSPEEYSAAFDHMRMKYGPVVNQGIEKIYRGNQEEGTILTSLNLPTSVLESQEGLYPMIIDSGLVVALTSSLLVSSVMVPGSETAAEKPVLPFVLSSLEVLSPCNLKMWAIIKQSPEQVSDSVQKLDITLYDETGKACAVMKGVSLRILEIAAMNKGVGAMMLSQVWKEKSIPQKASANKELAIHVIRFDENRSAAFEEKALELFEQVQAVIRSKPRNRHLFQVLIKDPLEYGLSGILKTAHLENPRIYGQVILVSDISNLARPIEEVLKENRKSLQDKEIWYEGALRQIKELEELTESGSEIKPPYKENGVYLITGGAGGLGLIFARDIVENTKSTIVILTGRSKLSAAKKKELKEIQLLGASTQSTVKYIQVDISNRETVQGLIKTIQSEHGTLNGLIHAAGVIKDNFILKKSSEEFASVLLPKIQGTIALDEATKEIDLDFFVLFSSVAGVMGNLGQADYATGNAFCDAFARQRNEQAAAKKRHGFTLSINWPLWKEGGMSIDEASKMMMREKMGLSPMNTAIGLKGFAQALSSEKDQVIVVEGFLKQMKQWLLPQAIVEEFISAPVKELEHDVMDLREKIEKTLMNDISKLLKIKIENLDLDIELSKYGFDSITLTDFANMLNQKYELELTPIIFFEYPTVGSFAKYLSQNEESKLAPHFSLLSTHVAQQSAKVENKAYAQEGLSTRKRARFVRSQHIKNEPEAIAIVGMAGQFPMAKDIAGFWNNLVEGKDCISEIPKSRWDWQTLWGDPSTEENRTNVKWSGFIEDTEYFDPLFFGISPREALLMDPQQRLLMQYVWLALEDAGYSAKNLSGTNTGMFIGTTGMGYNILLERAQIPIEGYSTTGVFPSIGPNRMSYFLNIHGPSEPIETSCSSSLVAIHRAVANIQSGNCEQAFVGGVNTISTPDGHISFSNAGMLSEDGRCKTFSKNANGYVRAEGVGILFLKKLNDAEASGDRIYGVIRGSAENHGGRANSLTAPNPKAQAELIKTAYSKAKIDPRSINYIEAHGTGTPLGDPVEINGLKTGFKELYEATSNSDIKIEEPHCGVGSVKTNIGHLELAAGVAGVIKVLLQLQHKKLVKSLHGEEQNPYIDLKESPFYLVKENQNWPALADSRGKVMPRRAGISSFGFGGSNAHVIIEEYVPQGDIVNASIQTPEISEANPALIILSAKNSERLKEYAQKLLAFIQQKNSLNLGEMAYTLQIGREAMEERLGIVVSSIEDCRRKLEKYIDDAGSIEGLYVGHVNKNKETLTVFTNNEDLKKTLPTLMEKKEHSKLLELWVKGLNIDWIKLYGDRRPRKVSLPTYPFAKEKYWVEGTESVLLNINKEIQHFLHPLVQQNTSTLSEQKFSSTFTGRDFFLRDHIVNGHKVLPGVAYLEMAREAVKLALGDPIANIQLKNIVWSMPIIVDAEPKTVNIRLFPEDNGNIAYEIYTDDCDSEALIHSQGMAVIGLARGEEKVPDLDLQVLKSACNQQELSSGECYQAFERMGIQYGPAHRGIEKIYVGNDSVLAKLNLPASLSASQGKFELHPSIMDSALQASIGMMLSASSENPTLPFSLNSLEVFSPCTSRMWASIRRSKERVSKIVEKLDIELSDEAGKVCVVMKGFSLRVLDTNKDIKEKNLASHLSKAQSHDDKVSDVDRKEVLSLGPSTDKEQLIEQVSYYLKKQLSTVLKLPVQKIESREPLEKYGIDSLMVIQLTNELEKIFGSLSKTLFFEYQTIDELSQYFMESYSSKLVELLQLEERGTQQSQASQNNTSKISTERNLQHRSRFSPQSKAPLESDEIAIIGISGKYPQSSDLKAYWENLRDGKDCITEIPSSRWDWKKYYDRDAKKLGAHYSKWGGFIEGVDLFDPLFFNISPREAVSLDPQERLFLEYTWMALEDAGLIRENLQRASLDDLPGQVGVYAGVMWNEYQLFGAESSLRGTPVSLGSSFASIANRVSYVLNLHGPSMTVDTMCSSSLTSIHLACEDLKSGRTDVGIAGGVNVSVHPNKYLALSNGHFISKDGHCQSFGEGGDGYIPGEGVGVVILKRLSNAIADGDHIYGIIKGTAINHGGRTNGYSVPNPNAQQMVIARALKESKVDPRTISYIEAHGTGTKLGDPIEITGLTKAFQASTNDTGYCAVGSAKSNIGHCESAAGIAGVTKVLLQMQHRQIVPSLHSETLNPNIDFEKTPFVVNQKLREWERPVVDGKEYPRIAGISSFGAGGSNAHVIIEEYIPEVGIANASVQMPEIGEANPVLIVLSAKNNERLKEYAQKLLAFVQQRNEDRENPLNLREVAYTLQIGREAMEERLCILASSMEDFIRKLEKYINDERSIEGLYIGQVNKNTLSVFTDDEDLKKTISIWIEKRKYSKLLELWVKGLNINWIKLYSEHRPHKISLPTYPFAKEKYWTEEIRISLHTARKGTQGFLHPLVHQNTSTLLSEQRFSSTFTEEEFFLKDHIINGQKMLPGVAYLEMAREAIKLALGDFKANIQLKDVVWVRPIIVEAEPKMVHIGLFPEKNGNIAYEIYTDDEAEVKVHSQGMALIREQGDTASVPDLDIKALKSAHNHEDLSSIECYEAFDRIGFKYGPAHRGIERIYIGEGSVLAKLNLPVSVSASQGEFELHPSVMDSALQASLGMVLDGDTSLRRAMLPFALHSLEVFSPCTSSMWAIIHRSKEQVRGGVQKLNIELCDEKGKVCVLMNGFSSRVLEKTANDSALMLGPVWKGKAIENPASIGTEMKVHIIRLDDIDPAMIFEERALELFEQVQTVIQSKPKDEHLFQVVINNPLHFGLSGILKTAHIENQKIYGQIILVSESAQAVEEILEENRKNLQDQEVWYKGETRRVKTFDDVDLSPLAVDPIYKENGIYLITGGAGGLGLIFAKDIVENTKSVTVILTGRSELSSAKAEELRLLQTLGEATRSKLEYLQADITNKPSLQALIETIQSKHGVLRGIIHAAGVIKDNFILKKNREEFASVLLPKVRGTIYLDELTKEMDLDFFVLFSSVAGAIGNLGQADYSTGNAFMDAFARERNAQVAVQKRHGQTLSINWPLWKEGGMSVDKASEQRIKIMTGMVPMETSIGLKVMAQSLASGADQMMVMQGNINQLKSYLAGTQSHYEENIDQIEEVYSPIDKKKLFEKVSYYLKKQLSSVLKLPIQKIEGKEALEKYGIDSVMVTQLTNELEKAFGSLSKTLFFEYQTIDELSQYFIDSHSSKLEKLLRLDQAGVQKISKRSVSNSLARLNLHHRSRFSPQSKAPLESDEIAIIGISGKYPQSSDLKAYWENLRDGKDCITEIPSSRWDWKKYYDRDAKKPRAHYSKWGGFIEGVDQFDPLFFNISPREAVSLDPQERLFLEYTWMALEDAGLIRENLQRASLDDLPGQVGVYAGVMWNEYQLFGAESSLRGTPVSLGSSFASIANRVSYVLNLHGPSMTVDTMCSSSLTSIHLACEDLKSGRTDVGIAGGVNVSIHPNKYLTLSTGQFISKDGHCQSFGEGGDGYIPGEGVGVVILKRLSNAIADGDHIYGIIKGTAINHGGKTNGYSVPNPNAQQMVIARALKESKVDPRTISYIEAHGTGTKLGDPIEITGLTKAFQASTNDTGYCAVGSAKSNIGHCESAAGIAGVTKVLLQMQHRQIVPSLHSETLNPNIDFEKTPFVVNQKLREWNRPVIDGKEYPRIAGISSFGAGGSNAHVIIEEYIPQGDITTEINEANPALIVLSAKNSERLKEYAQKLLAFIKDESVSPQSLGAMAYTLQVGREGMEERLGIIASSLDEVKEKLIKYLAGDEYSERLYLGHVKKNEDGVGTLNTDPEFLEAVEKWIANRKFSKILEFWTKGLNVDWTKLYREHKPNKISLPTYPFAKERYWLEAETSIFNTSIDLQKAQYILHPLVHQNTSKRC